MITNEFVDDYARINRHKGNREAQLLMFRQGLWLISQNGPTDLLPRRLGELEDMPVLVMNGKQDTLVPVFVAENFHKNINGSELAIVDQARHMPMIERPVETSMLVRDFLDRNVVVRGGSRRISSSP
uniref:Prolyl aminopeptidase n=1 Tax=Grammatophora oceanica TaxID=210454 RepID=A0A7S1YFW2_9STRA